MYKSVCVNLYFYLCIEHICNNVRIYYVKYVLLNLEKKIKYFDNAT